MNLRKRDTGIVDKLDAGMLSLEMDKDGDNLFLLGPDMLSKMGLSSKTTKPITYSAAWISTRRRNANICLTT